MFAKTSEHLGKSKWGLSNGGLKPLSAIYAQSSTLVHFCGLFRPVSEGNFRHKMATIVGNRGQLWTSTLSPHLLSPHLDFPEAFFVREFVTQQKHFVPTLFRRRATLITHVCLRGRKILRVILSVSSPKFRQTTMFLQLHACTDRHTFRP